MKNAFGWRLAGMLAVVALGGVGTAGTGPGAGANLIVNGDFNDPDNPLKAWKVNYESTSNSWYMKNHEFIEVLPALNGKKNVLQIKATHAELNVPGQGVIMDSFPVLAEPGMQYKLTASAKSDGPQCRILIEGYRWRPGVKPHDNPPLDELRKCYKSAQVYFGAQGGDFGGVGANWQTASQKFPQTEKSDLQQDNIKKVQFWVVHICAIGGSDKGIGSPEFVYLWVDDIKLEIVGKIK